MSQTMNLSTKSIKTILSHIIDPERDADLVSLDMVKKITINEDNVSIFIELINENTPFRDTIEEQTILLIRKYIANVSEISVRFKSKIIPIRDEISLPSVKHIIPIASTKGGVGKSTVTAKLAYSFAQAGHKVGIIDADIYGPNIPKIFNITDMPDITKDKKLVPVEAEGIKIISIGLLLNDGRPIIWRGPMLHTTIKQFLKDVVWGELDYLFIDLPPGTGDIQMSLCNMIELSGAVMITTPQVLSIMDVKKGMGMFRQLQVDIIGIIENMSYFIDPSNGNKHYIFGKDGGKNLSEHLRVPLINQIPIEVEASNNLKISSRYFEDCKDKIISLI